MKRKEKTMILAAALAICCAGTAFVTGRQAEEPETQSRQEGRFILHDWKADPIRAVSWESGDWAYSFICEDGEWIHAYDTRFIVNGETLDGLCDKLANMEAYACIPDAGDLADYGLEEPESVITVQGSSGETVTLRTGNETPFEDGWYVWVSDRPETVYAVSTSPQELFDVDPTQVAVMEELPDVREAASLSVVEQIDLVKTENGWASAADAEPVDDEAVQEQLEILSDFSWYTLEAVGATDEQLTQWGLDTAREIVAADEDGEVMLHLLIGKESDDGGYYARPADSTMVYTIYAEDIEPVLETSMQTMWKKTLPLPALGDTAQIELTLADGTSVRMQKSELHAEQTADAEEGEETAEVAFLINEEPDDEGRAQALYEQCTALTGMARVTAGTGEEAPVLTITAVNEQDETAQVCLYACDVEAYLTPITEHTAMRISADAVDRIIRTVRQLAR